MGYGANRTVLDTAGHYEARQWSQSHTWLHPRV